VDAAVRLFVQGRVEFSEQQLRIPQVFASIFGEEQNLMEWLVKQLNQQQLHELAQNHKKLQVTYQHYDWNRTSDLYPRRAKSAPTLLVAQQQQTRRSTPRRRYSERDQPTRMTPSIASMTADVSNASRCVSPTMTTSTCRSTPPVNTSPDWFSRKGLLGLELAEC